MSRKCKGGFTIIELSLSIVFISVLALSIVLIILNAVSSYRRGLTLNSINTNGMALVDDMRGAIQNSPSTAVTDECDTMAYSDEMKKECKNDGASKFVSLVHYSDVKINNKNTTLKDVPVYGAFCTGAYSYIWNSGYLWSEEVDTGGIGRALIRYLNANGEEVKKTGIRLLKIADHQRAVCKSVFKKDYNYDLKDFNGSFNIKSYNVISEEPVELLVNTNSDSLAIYDLESSAPSSNSTKDSLFYSVSFILGTIRGGINVRASGKSCSTPEGYADESFDYCAINRFSFAAQANGG